MLLNKKIVAHDFRYDLRTWPLVMSWILPGFRVRRDISNPQSQ